MSYYKDYASNQLQQQQDQHIEQITQIAAHLKNQGKQINRQLQKQQVYIENLDKQLDLTSNKLSTVHHKLGVLLETNDAGQICTFIMMIALAIIFTLCIIFV